MSDELREAADYVLDYAAKVLAKDSTILLEKAVDLAKAYLTEHAESEQKAARLRAELLAGDGKPVGTLNELLVCARMLDSYAAELFPAEKNGQVHFARAIMECVADEIRAFNANLPKEVS